MNTQQIKELLEKLTIKMEELKEMKGTIREIEADIPMELEELMLSRKDLSKQIKERKDEHINHIIETNDEYNEIREKIQSHKEETANLRLELFAAAANVSREHGDLDETVIIEGLTQRLQTQREVAIYLNGKEIKAA